MEAKNMTSRFRPAGLLFATAAIALTGFWISRVDQTSGPVAVAAQPADPALVPDPGKRVVAYIYNNVAITREEFGDYFITLYGKERLPLFVNERIIEMACAKKGAEVTDIEIDAAILEDCRRINVDKAEFIRTVLRRYGKTINEWRHDVMKPRLLLAKLCRDQIPFNDAEIQHMFENRYGEKAKVKIILWPQSYENVVAQMYEQLRQPGSKDNPDAAWDAVATKQPDANLAKSGGLIHPIGHHSAPNSAEIERIAFGLKDGDISPVARLPVPPGANPSFPTFLVVKRIGTIPAQTDVDFNKVKQALIKDVVDEKLDAEIPKLMEMMKTQAAPKLVLDDPKADHNVVAYVYGNVPITRAELGDYFISLYGKERLPYYVNRRIIEIECAKKGATVTDAEIEAAIVDDCKRISIEKKDFVRTVLKRYGKTFDEWRIDVLRPRLLLAKLCRDQIPVSDLDLKQMYENHYGEKAKVKIIVWPKGQGDIANRMYGQLRKPGTPEHKDADWDAVATKQPDPNLAASAGLIQPIGRYSGANSAEVEKIAFSLKEGDVSPIIELPIGFMVVKRVGTIPPQTGVDFEKVKAELRNEVIERKLDTEVPKRCQAMTAEAHPLLLLGGSQPASTEPSVLMR
jgi:ribosomal protein L32E